MYVGSFQENFQINFNPLNKRFTLFVAFSKPYLADQPLKPYKCFKRLTLYRLTVLLNNFLSFSKGLADWRTITKYSCLVRQNPSLHHDELQCLCYPIKAELDRIEKLGVILKVTSPTEWCAGMVVVSKPNGTASIYVDLTKLNQSACRERHILPSVEQVLAQIGNAKVLFRAWCQFRVLANRAHPRISHNSSHLLLCMAIFVLITYLLASLQPLNTSSSEWVKFYKVWME